jgi:peptidoglycan biosynthesis protein MviN/MurJ (putative lipid II flippase)
LLRLLGPQGVPIATAVGVLVGTCQFLVHYHRSTGQPLAPMAGPLAAAGMAAAVGWWLAPQLPDGLGRSGALLAVACRGSVVLLVAVAVLLALGSITAEDRERLARLLRRPVPRIAPVSRGEA